MYLLLSFIMPTIAELIVGKFFDKFLDISLWAYSHLPYNTAGYISLPISIFWAIAIFFFMLFVFDKIKNHIWRISHKNALLLAGIVSLSMIVDTVIKLINIK